MKSQRQQKNISNVQKTDLSSSVLSRIDKEHLEPTPRWRFLCGECTVWVLWCASILFGSIAVSVMIFISLYVEFSMYEAIHNTAFEFFIEVLPYLWIFIFIFMSILAYIHIRKTKKGYKYSFWSIILSSLLFSIIGGILLHFVGAGSFMDAQMDKNIPMYTSLEDTEIRMWQDPDDGRLVGRIKLSDEEKFSVQFIDIEGTEWVINTEELLQPDLDILYSGNQVRILGVLSRTTDYNFYGCGVFPWMFDENIKLSNMKKERSEFVKRMYQHKDKTNERLQALYIETFGTNNYTESSEGVCAKSETVLRIDSKMNKK